MITRITAIALTLTLTACGAVTIAPPSQRVTVPASLPAAEAPADLRARARAFIEVLDRVEPVAEAECRAANPARNCDFRIVVDDRPGQPPNAFQTQDESGRPLIAFTLSLIAQVENPDELAFILGHETGHHIAGHLDRANQAAVIGATVFGQIAGTLAGADAQSIQTAQQIGAAVAARSYSKDFELEADALGTIIAARAGYDPVLGAQFFLRIPDPGNRFLGTHPPNAERMAVVRSTAAQLGL
jgi:predicted Zn-dependent protease